MSRFKYFIVLLVFLLLLVPVIIFASVSQPQKQWAVQSIDTMKYSRDLARQKLTDASFDPEIDAQIRNIALTGANYVSIATPYDKEFLPMLRRWVAAARKYHLHVWFRGNFSGWEQWFSYPKITRKDHTRMVKAFILANADIFQNGDIFTSCPECENGTNLNTGSSKEVAIYRVFLIGEYQTAKSAFKSIGKDVIANYYSMNGDVARAVMDRHTTQALDGIVTIDHYVAKPEELARDIRMFAERSGGKVVLGEFGAPIQDLQGAMNEYEQDIWVSHVLSQIDQIPELIGVNYWVNMGGSTALWRDDKSPKPVVASLTKHYSAKAVQVTVKDEKGAPLSNVSVRLADMSKSTGVTGQVFFPYAHIGEQMILSMAHYNETSVLFSPVNNQINILLLRKDESLWGRFVSSIRSLFVH